MKFTQILLASSVAALVGATRTRIRQDAEEGKVKGACKEMCDYYDKCGDEIRGEDKFAVEAALQVILDGGELLRSDGSAFENIRELECQLRYELNEQVESGDWDLDDTELAVCPDLVYDTVGHPFPVFDEECAAKEVNK